MISCFFLLQNSLFVISHWLLANIFLGSLTFLLSLRSLTFHFSWALFNIALVISWWLSELWSRFFSLSGWSTYGSSLFNIVFSICLNSHKFRLFLRWLGLLNFRCLSFDCRSCLNYLRFSNFWLCWFRLSSDWFSGLRRWLGWRLHRCLHYLTDWLGSINGSRVGNH